MDSYKDCELKEFVDKVSFDIFEGIKSANIRMGTYKNYGNSRAITRISGNVTLDLTIPVFNNCDDKVVVGICSDNLKMPSLNFSLSISLLDMEHWVKKE